MALSRLSLLVLVLVLPGCGGYLDGLGLPTAASRPCTEATEWVLSGFNGNDVPEDGTAPVVELTVGESRELFVGPFAYSEFDECAAAIASVRWTSTHSRVASFGPGAERAWLTANDPGETEIRADVTLTTGQTYRALLSVFLAVSGQSAHTVRVVAAAPLPRNRKVIYSGQVTLEPNSGGSGGAHDIRQPFEVSKEGTLDMVVNWLLPGNRVIAHVCPGVVPPGLGCVPVIDGTQAWGEKPTTGSAQVTPGTYSFWITNEGPDRETVTYEAGLVAK